MSDYCDDSEGRGCGMLSQFRRALLLFALASLAGGCARNSLVVLVPDPDGQTGRITVANQAGSVEIVSPNQATNISDVKTAPTPPAQLDQAAINSLFAQALAIQPKRPVHFILYFEKDTALTAESARLLADILTAVKERDSSDIMVVGHADTVGSRDFNMVLSKSRATTVTNLLVSKGVGVESIRTTSHGKENPLIPTDDNVNEPRNRRVEVVVR
jgi:outer membrane protein OmpA-like peptidoglycan-associated protein